MITLNAFSPTPVDLTPVEASLYGQMDRVRQATNAGIRRWVHKWQELFLGCRVLDFGAGRPGTCRIPQPFRELLREAKEYVPWEPGDEDLPLNSGSFGAILCTQVIQNVEAPFSQFEEFNSLLTPRGYLVLTYPVAWEEIENEYWRFTKKGLWLLCHDSGFDILQHETLVNVAIDGSLNLALVNGLVARRREP
jgi:SAM-dependent methyltransferase